MRSAAKNILRWFAGIGANFNKPTDYSSQPRRPASDIAAETRAESAVDEAVAVGDATESGVATPTKRAVFTVPVTSDAEIGQDAEFNRVASNPPDQQEIQRRRELIRRLFNDFWRACDDKPAAFVDRLDQAETYLNDRLTACGGFWQLDAKTRKILGLPPRSNSPNEGNGAAPARHEIATKA